MYIGHSLKCGPGLGFECSNFAQTLINYVMHANIRRKVPAIGLKNRPTSRGARFKFWKDEETPIFTYFCLIVYKYLICISPLNLPSRLYIISYSN